MFLFVHIRGNPDTHGPDVRTSAAPPETNGSQQLRCPPKFYRGILSQPCCGAVKTAPVPDSRRLGGEQMRNLTMILPRLLAVEAHVANAMMPMPTSILTAT